MIIPISEPNILKETSGGVYTLNIRDEMLLNREVECFGTIDGSTVNSLCRQLRHLQLEDPEKEITMFINSPGGEVQNGLALYDIMQAVTCPIRTVCVGTASSMAAVIFAAGDSREIFPHGKIMIHDPLISAGPGGSALEVKQISRDLLKVRDILCGILAERTGKPVKDIRRKTSKDAWFTAEEAVDFGLADRIITSI